MTEKRFDFLEKKGYGHCIGIIDNHTGRHLDYFGIRELMNEVVEEKEILEVQLRSATNEIDKLMDEINTLTDTCHDCCKEIREENEQLKKQNKELKSTVEYLKNQLKNYSEVSPDGKWILNQGDVE